MGTGPPAIPGFFSAVLRAARRGIGVRELPVQPALGVSPVALGAALRDPEHLRRLPHRHAAEIAQDDEPGGEGIDRLAGEDPTAASLVRLRYYAGLSLEQAAEPLGISTATAYRHWSYARAWLLCALLDRRE